MMTARETIYNELFTIASGAPGLVTKSRRLRAVRDVSAAEQPALFQVQGKERAISHDRRGIPNRWELLPFLVVYTNCGESLDVAPSTQLNDVLDYLESMFPADPTTAQTMGLSGVQEVRISGDISMDEGVLGAQAYAVIPIRIVAI